jgi:hypothetical protein
MATDYVPEPLPPFDAERRRRAGESLDAYIERVWPEAAKAVADVDRTLFLTTLPLSPIERLEQATRAAWELEELRQSIRDAKRRK